MTLSLSRFQLRTRPISLAESQLRMLPSVLLICLLSLCACHDTTESSVTETQHVTPKTMPKVTTEVEATEENEGQNLAVPSAPPIEGLRQVVLITIDTLRADHLQSYGYSRETSPNLLNFSKHAIQFESAWAHSSETQEAMPPLLTGTFPSSSVWENVPHSAGLFAQLNAHNVKVQAYVSNRWLSPERGYAQGVTHFEMLDYYYPPRDGILEDASIPSQEKPLRAKQKKAARSRVDGSVLVNRVLKALSTSAGKRLFWLHLMDVHNPYRPPAPFWGKFGFLDGRDRYVNGPAPLDFSTEDRNYMTARYDEGIRYTDSLLAPLLRALSSPARRRDTMVILTADHGESLGEQQQLGHGTGLTRELLRVPLLIQLPIQSPHNADAIQDAVAHYDLTPTILEAFGIPAGANTRSGFMGQSLLTVMRSNTRPDKESSGTSGVDARSNTFRQNSTRERSVPCAVKGLHDGRLRLGFIKADSIHSWNDSTHSTPTTGKALDSVLSSALRLKMAKLAADRTPAEGIHEDARSRLNALGYVEGAAP